MRSGIYVNFKYITIMFTDELWIYIRKQLRIFTNYIIQIIEHY